ncbi:hypothetical protein T440DRAFT_508593 [Plenodomus tracheiphilus IPT5]|uniref:CENP-V/GFA domain-containing protein n=1 Tax=Plenodomus tracheiphilus IPT5 TaxID=1408161 RepID=A0A6A7B3D4_9PLEO|nr:hypothetical protein T440DRAFT_508593 [Plenodomus tracheiphilus IPT5]
MSLKAYPGSCHCGTIQYKIKLKFPPEMKSLPNSDTIRVYKCNCTTCQKMGLFHCRPIDPATDFILTSPSPSELGDYRTGVKKNGWYYCKTCGVRVFGMGGEWEQVELDVEHWSGRTQEPGKDKAQKVWRTKGKTITETVNGEEKERFYHYLSVNAVTLEPGEEVDLNMWHEKGWVFYVGNLEKVNGSKMRVEKPFRGGMY